MQPLEIFRTGRHTATSGTELAFGEADLSAIASGYDPELSPAPIVVGHPAMDAPAYGWVESLTVEGDRLVATPRQVDPAFADLVRAGRYKTRSASFFLPDAPNNPTPGRYYLRHVGFLGAHPPAVKGLRPVAFGDAEAGTVSFSDIGFATGIMARMFRRLRDWLIETQGIDAADKVVADWEVQELASIQVAERAAGDTGPASLPFADPPSEDPQMPDPAAAPVPGANDLARREAAVAAAEAALTARTREARRAEDMATVDAVIAAGRLPKGLRERAVILFGQLDEGSVEFGEPGSEETLTSTPRALFADLLSKLPQPFKTGEIATGDLPAVDFGDPVALGLAINEEIAAVKKSSGEDISPADALGRIKKGRAG